MSSNSIPPLLRPPITPVLAVIPARGGSKGLPGKNIRPLAGLPLIVHSIRCAQRCIGIDRIVVSTDSEAIATVAREAGADVPFLRPADLAQDTTPMWPVLQHALSAIEAYDGVRYGSLLLLDPTNPARRPEDIQAAIETLAADPACDGVIGVHRPEANPLWHSVVVDGGYLKELVSGAGTFVRRQDVPEVYSINGTLYLWRRNYVLSATNWRDGRLRPQQVDEQQSIAIDSLEQFHLVDVLLREGLLRFPWLEEK